MITLSIIIFVVSLFILIKTHNEYKENDKLVENLIKNVVREDSTENKPIIDWKKLKDINEDIIGWIKIDNTNINYPILKDTDNLYYLKHSYNRNYNSSGSIFTINSNCFLEGETTIHGHNMKNGKMFSELEKYLDKSFFYSNSNFKIYTPMKEYKATVFSSYLIDIDKENENTESLNFNEKIEYYKNSSKYLKNDIGNINKIVKLSTCSYLNNHIMPTKQRCFVVAKLE